MAKFMVTAEANPGVQRPYGFFRPGEQFEWQVCSSNDYPSLKLQALDEEAHELQMETWRRFKARAESVKGLAVPPQPVLSGVAQPVDLDAGKEETSPPKTGRDMTAESGPVGPKKADETKGKRRAADSK